jgi:hypothetical protein
MEFIKSKFGGMISVLIVLIMSASLFTMFTGQTNNGAKPFRSYYDGSVSWYDSLGNIDSLNYPYYLNGGKFEDFSLINGQTTINYRCAYISASTNDTVLIIVETKPEGANTMYIDCDTIRLPAKTSMSSANTTVGTFSFSTTTAQNWRFRVAQGTAGDGTANRNNGYLLFTTWSNTLNTVPPKFKLGNY